MKNQWLVWFFVIGVVAVVLFAFNYQGNQDFVSVSELFPEEDVSSPDIEYEFVTETEPIEEIAEEPSIPPVPPASAPTTQVASEPAPAPQDFREASFTIQVSSHKNREQADRALKAVQEAGYPAQVVSKNLGERGTWHRIYVGAFDNKQEADEFLTKVKDKYSTSFIIAPSK